MGGLDGPPKPPGLGRAPAEPWARLDVASGAWGPRRAPQAPRARTRPGGAVARLDVASRAWGPRRAPIPPTADRLHSTRCQRVIRSPRTPIRCDPVVQSAREPDELCEPRGVHGVR